ncbi:MAG: carbohydrate kinase family protein [Solirubrobacteraceae bacterium]
MPEAIVAGHISLDVYPALRGPVVLEPGRLVVVGPAEVSTGGAVANVGVALHRLGVDVGLVAKVGGDLFGRAVLEALGKRLAAGIALAPAEVTSYTIVLNPPDVDRCFLHCPGANETFSSRDVPYEELAGARLFHFGYPPLMPVMYTDAGAELRTMFARVQSEAGAATSLDMCGVDPDSDAGRVDWLELLAATLPFVDVFAPSLGELAFMLDRSLYERLQAGTALVDHAMLAELAATLTALGVAVVVIKLGEHGLYVRTSGELARIRAFCARAGLADAGRWRDHEVLSPCFAPARVLGTTGSGDATIAGLLAALLRGEGPVEAATSATAVGACSVEAVDPTSGVPRWEHVGRRISAGWARLSTGIPPRPGAGYERDATGTMVTLR